MQQNMKVFMAAICLGLLALRTSAAEQHQHQNHLQCWQCSSDTIGAEDFCGTVFLERNIPTDLLKEQKINILRYCNSTIHSDHERPVCRKTIEEANGKTITKRFCYYTNKSDALDHCNHSNTDKNVRRIFCQDCLSDKCNAGNKMTTTLLSIILVAVSVAKVLVA